MTRVSMADSCAEVPVTLLPLPQNIMEEFQAHLEDGKVADFCDIRRKSSVTSRRKPRRSMNFTPEKVLLLAASESPAAVNSDALNQDCIQEEPQFQEAPILFNGSSFSSEDTDTTAVCDKPVNHKKYRRRRRSADFEIIQNIQANLSPDIEMEGLDELQKLPGSRKSRRLKRQSIELCKTAVMQNMFECNSPITESPATSVTSSPVTAESTTPDKQQCQPDSTSQDLGYEDQLNPTDLQTTDSPIPNTESEGKPPAKRGKKGTPKQKGSGKGQRKQKSPEPDLEAIYKNKLWKSQMPKEASWETIYEDPRLSKGGKMELCSAKRFRRALNYDDFFNKQKLKRRRQKAKALGFKPMTAKRKAVAAAALDVRLQDLEAYLQQTDSTDFSEEDCGHKSGTLEYGCVKKETNNNIEEECADNIVKPTSSTSHRDNTECDSEEGIVSPETSDLHAEQPTMCVTHLTQLPGVCVTQQTKQLLICCPEEQDICINECTEQVDMCDAGEPAICVTGQSEQPESSGDEQCHG